MEATQNTKNTDCYFYYYSTCSRENCAYRHEPSSRGCEVTCQQWKEGKCTNPHCGFRHMEIKKKRSEISCYWENQPSGCLKAHCPFMHQNKVNTGQGVAPAPIANKEAEAAIASHEIPQWNAKTSRSNHESLPGTANAPDELRRLSQSGSDGYASPPVEPVIVSFEEESDSESTKSWSPCKVPSKDDSLGVKTLEETRLDEIQAEQAAYWQNVAGGPITGDDIPDTSPILDRSVTRKVSSSGVVKLPKMSEELDFKVLSLEEIRRNRRREKLEGEQVISSSSVARPSILSRLGYNGDTPSRQVSSTTEDRKSFKRVHSPDFTGHSLKRNNLENTEDFYD